MTSFSSKVVCVVRSIKERPDLTAKEVEQIAAALDPFSNCGEPIAVKAVPKSSGEGWRPICAYGPKRQALQTLCLDILVARFGEDECNYLRKGRGADRASDRINQLVDEGYRYFVLFDVKDFFRSVQQEKVEEVTGLPKEVVRTCILNESAPVHIVGYLPHKTDPETLHGAAHEGLPQGSRASQFVAGLLFGPALRSVASADRIIFHGDDGVIAACHEQEAVALNKALIGVFQSHPAGPFRLKRHEIAHVSDGVSFLKYRSRLDHVSGEVRRHPAAASYARYQRRVEQITVESKTQRDFMRALAGYRWRWMQSFPRWRWNQVSRLNLWFTTFDGVKLGERRKQKLKQQV